MSIYTGEHIHEYYHGNGNEEGLELTAPAYDGRAKAEAAWEAIEYGRIPGEPKKKKKKPTKQEDNEAMDRL